jgi:ankyrin repeat protein
MKIKIFLAVSMLINSWLMNAMSDVTYFWSALTSKKYEEVKSFLEYNSSLINSSISKPHNTPIFFAVESKDIILLKILLSRGANIYSSHAVFGSLIYEAMCYGEPEIVKALIDQHKTNGEPEDSSEFGFCGEHTLFAVRASHNPTIILAFEELQEHKKMRDEIRDDLNRYQENKNQRLFEFVKLHNKYVDIAYLVSLQRD